MYADREAHHKNGAVNVLRYFGVLLVVAVLVPAQPLQPGATLPQIKGTTLDEQEITLPDAVAGKITLLIITFSKTGGRTWPHME